MSDCESCSQIKALENTVKGFVINAEQQLIRLNKESVNYEQRISKLESGSAVSEERFKQVFEKLDDIIYILKERENRLPTLMWSVLGMTLGGALVGVIMWAWQTVVA